MALLEDAAYVFIVRIWRPAADAHAATAPLRAVIEDVRSGEREPLTELDEIVRFVRRRVGTVARPRRRPWFAWRWRRRLAGTE